MKTDGELRGEIRICAGSSYAMGVLPEIILKFKELHPNVNVIVKISDYPEDTTQKLARGEIDFLVCMDEENAYPEFLTVSKKREPVIFVTHPGNPLLEKNNMTLEEAVSNQYITSDRDIGYCALLEKELRKRGIEPEPVIEMGSPGAIINMLLDGYGISYIPKFMAEKYIECGQLAEIDVEGIDINMHSYYLCSRHRWMNPIMDEFIRVVKEN